jgi:ATP-dependent DNA ligase
VSNPEGADQLPDALRGPVEVALARSQDTVPAAADFAGGCAYELKWDGFRLVVVRRAHRTTLWSRRGTDLTRRFPDLVRAVERQVPPGVVLDGEVVVWNGERLDFDLLSRRLVTGPSDILALAARWPASYVAFDVLARDDRDLRARSWARRRTELEDLASSWRAPLQLTPATEDIARATAWSADYRPAGVEGLVVKPLRSRYTPGRRVWVKVKSRATHELILGGVLGTTARPDILVLGRYCGPELVMVARSVPLDDVQAGSLAGLLRPAYASHPWPDHVRGGRFGQPGEVLALTRVAPVVVEVTADVATHAGAFRHAVRFLRARPDMAPADVPERN